MVGDFFGKIQDRWKASAAAGVARGAVFQPTPESWKSTGSESWRSDEKLRNGTSFPDFLPKHEKSAE
jgi:hypothetical protein